ncbi:MAG: hypothetical protein V2I97_09430, partial [Desulfococcaceae bacterium]|jgi:hypothetical protein|nr:hypothetical protein [Desulfococcaceae bacterium]
MPLDEGQDALVSDADGPGLDYGYLHVEITEGGSAEDILKIAEDADGDGDSTTGISANTEGDVSYDNNYIGYIGSDFGNTVLKIFFYSEYADTTAVSQLIRAVRYENTAAELPSEAKTVLVKIYDGYAYSFPASVTVSFASLYTVTVSVSGGGSVSGPGISCSPECAASFPYGTKVFLQAQPYSGYIFSGWTGDLQSAAAGISVTVDGDKYITAAFTMVHNPYPYPGPSTDLCPSDPLKTAPGICGCGVADTDRDGDGIYDCKDGCPDDPGKSEEGVCGCGTADTDRDGDGIPDCKDGCPDDPFKTAPGVCGCGTEDTDRDGDDIPDCEGNEPPSPPQPADGEDTKIYPDGTVTLQTAPFSDAEGDSHLETVWMIYKSADPCDQSLIQHTSSADLTEFTVSGLLPGMIYRWKAGFRDSGSGKISWSEEQTLIVGEKIREESIWVEPGTEISDYRMITFPFWSENPAASRVLSEEIGGNYDIKYFRIGEFDTESGEYTEYGPDLAFLPGRSYWFLARNGLEIPQIGVPVTLEEDADIRLAYNPLTGEGWNMAGVPGNADFFWHDVEVVIGGSGCETLAVGDLPEDNPYINIYLWQWRGDGYSPDTEIMESGKGYWVRARQGNIWLRFPADKWYPPGQAGTLSARRGGNIVKSPSSRRARTGNGESPPMPPGVLDTSENEASGSGGETSGDGGGGCFIRVIR